MLLVSSINRNIYKSSKNQINMSIETFKINLIENFRAYLLENLRNQFEVIRLDHRFDNRDLDIRATRHIYCERNRFNTEDENLEKVLVFYNLQRYKTRMILTEIEEAHKKGIPILYILHKYIKIDEETHGDFYSKDKGPTKMERTLFDIYGELVYFDSNKRQINLVALVEDEFKIKDFITTFKLTPRKSVSKYKRVGLEYKTLENRSVA